jgi:cytochrome c1
MPSFSRLGQDDIDALYTFLRTMPKIHRPNRPGGATEERAVPSDPPSVLFAKVGCVNCHGEGAPFRDKIAPSATKSDEDVAAWILDPQATKPGAPMPSFKAVLDRDQALALARYAKSLAAARSSL